MSEIFTASQQWAHRPADERFTSLTAMEAAALDRFNASTEKTLHSKQIKAVPASETDYRGLQLQGPGGNNVNITNWAFNQLCGLARVRNGDDGEGMASPASYLKRLPSPLAADCINYALGTRSVEDIKVLLTKTDSVPQLRAITGPNYGRIWDAEMIRALIENFGNGTGSNEWTVPGTFGKKLDEITEANTTLYSGDKDFFAFLANEKNKIDVPNRRNGQHGSMSRGFFTWGSEVGGGTAGGAFFLFDYVCCNRIVWGAEEFKEIRIRHTKGAPLRWLEEIVPVLTEYANSSAGPVEAMLKAAQNKKIENVKEFMTSRFAANQTQKYIAAFERDEGRPMESLFDITTGMTAYARELQNQDTRVDIERQAGKLLELVAA